MQEQTGLCSLCTHDYCMRKSQWMVCNMEFNDEEKSKDKSGASMLQIRV